MVRRNPTHDKAMRGFGEPLYRHELIRYVVRQDDKIVTFLSNDQIERILRPCYNTSAHKELK